MERIDDGAWRGEWVERIKWTTLARVVALSALLMFAVAMDLGMGPQPLTPSPDVILYQLITAGFVLSFIALLGTYLLGDGYQQPLAWASVGVDAVLTGALVATSHGLDSVFLFTLPLAVLSGSVLLERRGGFVAAAIGTCVLFLMAAIDLEWLLLDRESWTMSWVRVLAPHPQPVPFDVALAFMVQVGALYATALLSSHLMVELAATRTQAHADQRALAALRVRYADVFSSMPDGLATVARDGTITTVNAVFVDIIGRSEADTVGRPLAEVLPEYAGGDGPTPSLSQTTEILRDSIKATAEVTRNLAAGSQIVAVRSVALHSEEGVEGTLLVIRDTTELRAREDAHRNRERLATIGAMAMAVAHEIRNPLASISGAVQMLESGSGDDAGDRELMNIAVRETNQLSEWIGEFLDYAKPQKVQLIRIDLAKVVSQKISACRSDPAIAEAGIDIKLKVHEPASGAGWTMMGDESRLGSLVWNLLINARQAVLDSGQRLVSVALWAETQSLLLSVADSGPGVPDEDKGSVFEPFYTTKGEGTGLGLATVKRVVVNHEGEILVRDSAMGGAEFVIRLPRRLEPESVQPS